MDVYNVKKIELHRHLEGCIDPVFFQSHLEQHFPDDKLLQENMIDQLFSYNNFHGFLSSWATVMQYFTDYEHFRGLARHSISQLNDENIKYAELIFSPQPFVNAGLDLEQIFSIMFAEFDNSSVHTKIIVDFVRNFGENAMTSFLPSLIDLKQSNDELSHWIRAISIGGDEVNYPASLFTVPFKKAKESGFHLYAHAGEWLGAESVWDSMNLLGVERIGHGIRSVDDENLMTHLKRHNIGLDISITSNYQTEALAYDQDHPIAEIYEFGIPISINTDDPGFFHTDLNSEYQKFLDYGFELDDLSVIINQAIGSSFLTDDEREVIRKQLN